MYYLILVVYHQIDMDPALLKERELFKLKASAIPVYVHYNNIKRLYLSY